MSDPNEAFDRALAEIAEAMKRLDARGHELTLPEYTYYGGLRIVEESDVARPEPVDAAA